MKIGLASVAALEPPPPPEKNGEEDADAQTWIGFSVNDNEVPRE